MKNNCERKKIGLIVRACREQYLFFSTPFGRSKNKRAVCGFTLIELLLAITLFAVVIASSTGVFSLGLEIWKRTRDSAFREQKLVIAFEKMGQDIRTMIKIRAQDDVSLFHDRMEYGGDNHKVSLPALVPAKREDGTEMTQYGRISYRWNPSTKVLCRSVENATQFYQHTSPLCQVLVENVNDAKFQYWLYDGLSESYSWNDQWKSKEGLPQAIRISARLSNQMENEVPKNYQRTILVPVGS